MNGWYQVITGVEFNRNRQPRRVLITLYI